MEERLKEPLSYRAEIVRDENGVGAVVGLTPFVPRRPPEPIMNEVEREALQEVRDGATGGEEVPLSRLEQMAVAGSAALMQSARRAEMGFGLKSLVSVMNLRMRREEWAAKQEWLRIRQQQVDRLRAKMDGKMASAGLLMPGRKMEKSSPVVEVPESRHDSMP